MTDHMQSPVVLLFFCLSPEPPVLFPSASFLCTLHVSLSSSSSGLSPLNTAIPMWLSSQTISSDFCRGQFPVVVQKVVFESLPLSILSHLFQLQKCSCLPLLQVTPLPYFYHRHCYHLVFQAYLLHPGRPLWPHISTYSCPLCLMALQVTLMIQQVLTDQSRSVWSLESKHSCS